MKWLETIARALLDVTYPHRCVLCGADRAGQPWCRRGARVPGLRPWDEAQLCRACRDARSGDPVLRREIATEGGPLPVLAAAATGPELVRLVAAWKYHGLRGLAWPLAELLEEALRGARRGPRGDDLLTPVPLHRARRRARGFNQAEILAGLLSAGGWGGTADLLERRRSTRQQAKLGDDDVRAANLAGAFRCRRPDAQAQERRVFLIDDLVTSGATAAAAAAALREGGWKVGGVLALGAVPVSARGEEDAEAVGDGHVPGRRAGLTPPDPVSTMPAGKEYGPGRGPSPETTNGLDRPGMELP